MYLKIKLNITFIRYKKEIILGEHREEEKLCKFINKD